MSSGLSSKLRNKQRLSSASAVKTNDDRMHKELHECAQDKYMPSAMLEEDSRHATDRNMWKCLFLDQTVDSDAQETLHELIDYCKIDVRDHGSLAQEGSRHRRGKIAARVCCRTQTVGLFFCLTITSSVSSWVKLSMPAIFPLINELFSI